MGIAMMNWTIGSALRRIVIPSLVLLALITGAADRAGATELVIFESTACEWCETWNKEIGGIYHNTVEAQSAPLRRVDVDDGRPDDLAHINGIVYTPTFVMMKDGIEVGRIIGYPGEDFFWQLLNELIVKAKAQAPKKS